MIKEAIVKIVNKEDLTYNEAYAVMNEIMSGETTATQNAAFLAALSTKSARAETTDEIAGCAAAMRAHATKVETDMELFEIVGTGGDNAHSFNISTTSALVAAAGGMKVAKHGNRAASSQCGTADCLEALGVNIQQSPEKCVELLREAGMCFFFAQKYHASMKYVGAIRKELGFRTVFNILGPLTNPGAPSMQLLGVYDEYLVEPLAQVLINLGVKRGMVVYGQDKLDEISMSAPTTVCEIRDGWFKYSVITPEMFGFERCTKEELRGGSPKENADIMLSILNGERGPKRNAVLMNSGGFSHLPVLVFLIAEISPHTGNSEILAPAVKGRNAVILPRYQPPVFIKGGLHGKLVMLKCEVGFRCAIVRIFRADMFECCQQRHLLSARLQTLGQQGRKPPPVPPRQAAGRGCATRTASGLSGLSCRRSCRIRRSASRQRQAARR